MLKEDKDQNSGRLSDQFVIQFYKERLLSMPCQNQVILHDRITYIIQLLQGFVVDGFPKTYTQAKQLFDLEEMEEPEQEGATAVTYNQLIMPGKDLGQEILTNLIYILFIEVVISLTATDDFLKQRVINLPESVVSGTHNNEEGYITKSYAWL